MAKFYSEWVVRHADIQNKDKGARVHIDTMLNRTASMFEYDGLPDTLPQRNLELYLQTNGNAFVMDVNDDLYAFTGGLGGEYNAYYEPTLYTIANPCLNISGNYEIGKDGIMVRNDTTMSGLLPLITRTAYMLSENEISLWLASVNQRIISLITAENENAKKSADEFLKQIFKGNLGVILGKGLTEGITTQPYAHTGGNAITQLIELEQYLDARLLNTLGLNANYNMKREALSMTESQMNHDALLPLVDDMLHQREIGVDAINKMYGTNIKVRLHSAWADLQKETAEAVTENIDAGVQNDDSTESISELEN